MSSPKYQLTKFLVPIYIETRVGSSPFVTLANALGAMEDTSGQLYADTEDMTSCDVVYDALPEGADDYTFYGRNEEPSVTMSVEDVVNTYKTGNYNAEMLLQQLLNHVS